MKQLNAAQLDAILSVCQAERLCFYLDYSKHAARISVNVSPSDRMRAADSGVRSINRFSTDPDKALGRLHEELAKRFFGTPQASWEPQALAEVINEIVSIAPVGFSFGANFYQRGTRPYFFARLPGMYKDVPQGNDAVVVCQATLQTLQAKLAQAK